MLGGWLSSQGQGAQALRLRRANRDRILVRFLIRRTYRIQSPHTKAFQRFFDARVGARKSLENECL
jgi:hypothetical protein